MTAHDDYMDPQSYSRRDDKNDGLEDCEPYNREPYKTLIAHNWKVPANVDELASMLNTYGGRCYAEHVQLLKAFFAVSAMGPHNWQCYLDGKHGSQEVWKCACGDEVHGDPHKCRMAK